MGKQWKNKLSAGSKQYYQRNQGTGNQGSNLTLPSPNFPGFNAPGVPTSIKWKRLELGYNMIGLTPTEATLRYDNL